MVARISKPYQLLIADDDAAFRDTLCDIFAPFFRTFAADSGEEAIGIVESRRVDLLLLDMHMDRLTGLDTLKIVKTINAAAPCILITADFTDALEQAATQAQAYSVLAKPVTRQLLLATVSTAIEDVYQDPDAMEWSDESN